MYTLKNLRNMMKNHTGMLVLLVISMFVSFGVLFFGVGLYYQYSKNIEDGEIDSYAVGFSINDIITKKIFVSLLRICRISLWVMFHILPVFRPRR